MSTIKSSAENLTLNADGANNDIKFQSNGSEVASIDQAGLLTATSFAGSGANLTGVGVDGISSSANATAITIDSSERVGVGTTSPLTNSLLHIQASASSGVSAINNGLLLVENSTGVGVGLLSNNDRQQTIAFGDPQDNDVGFINYGHDTNQMSFNVNAAERLRITANGITFNGDTAAANALDDYEEGTWTPAIAVGSGITMGTIHAANYTKIGNTCTLSTSVEIASSSVPASGDVRISGFPFGFKAFGEGNYPVTLHYTYRQTTNLYMNTSGYMYYQNTNVGGNNVESVGPALDALNYLAITFTYLTT